MGTGASQLHTGWTFLEVESFLQSKLQCFSRVRGGSPRDASNILVQKINRLRIFEVRDKKIALHFHDLLLAEQTR